MRKNLTEIVFILDRSGSMSGLEADTIGGFNSMIEKQKKAEGEALISTVLFDNTSEVIHDRVSVQNIKPMTDEDYTVRGCECCVTSFINLVKEAAYPIFLILSRKSKRTVDVARIFFVCRMSMAI